MKENKNQKAVQQLDYDKWIKDITSANLTSWFTLLQKNMPENWEDHENEVQSKQQMNKVYNVYEKIYISIRL
jgi:hypothetical protein